MGKGAWKGPRGAWTTTRRLGGGRIEEDSARGQEGGSEVSARG